MARVFPYDVFISYSHHDKPWALRFHTELEKMRVKTFLDSNRLEEGKPWEEGLLSSLEKSQHLLVLHSSKAKDSSWVQREMATFDVRARDDVDGDRRLLVVLLDASNPGAYNSIQMVEDLQEMKLYSKGISSLDENPPEWNRFVQKLGNLILRQQAGEPIPVVLVTLKDSEVAELDPAASDPGGREKPLESTLRRLGLDDIAVLRQRYGPERRNWKPFGGHTTVENILNQQVNLINQKLARTFRWSEIDLFSTDFQTAQDEVRRRFSKRRLILIDPIAFYHPKLANRFSLLHRSFEDRDSMVLVLTPFGRRPEAIAHSAIVQSLGAPYFDDFYDPPVPYNAALATCHVDVDDQQDMATIVLSTLIRQEHQGRTEPASPFV